MIDRGKVSGQSEVVFVDDGSRDNTWSIIKAAHLGDRRICGIKLSANRRHQTALLAGLFGATGDAVVTVDADLQDDLSAIERMVDAYHAGKDVVYGVR